MTHIEHISKSAWTFEKTERAVHDLCQKVDKYAHKLIIEDLKNDEYCSLIPDLSLRRVNDVIESTKRKIEAGLRESGTQYTSSHRPAP
ncbi:MAG: hypothetical protein U5L72_09010 [Bacteroidales bacterium]|nr:hypothetical protein [Bacteroidales bacterium]